MKVLYSTIVLLLVSIGYLIHVEYAIAGFFLAFYICLVLDLEMNSKDD